MPIDQPPYALIIAEVVEYNRGDIRIRYKRPDGEEDTIWMDTSSIAPLQKEQAEQISKQWEIGLPG